MTADRKLNEALAQQKAAAMWPELTENERRAVRFGMFPAQKMQQATAELLKIGVEKDAGRLLAVALMEIAEKNGGMIA